MNYFLFWYQRGLLATKRRGRTLFVLVFVQILYMQSYYSLSFFKNHRRIIKSYFQFFIHSCADVVTIRKIAKITNLTQKLKDSIRFCYKLIVRIYHDDIFCELQILDFKLFLTFLAALRGDRIIKTAFLNRFSQTTTFEGKLHLKQPFGWY